MAPPKGLYVPGGHGTQPEIKKVPGGHWAQPFDTDIEPTGQGSHIEALGFAV